MWALASDRTPQLPQLRGESKSAAYNIVQTQQAYTTPGCVNHRQDGDLRRAVLHQLKRIVGQFFGCDGHRFACHKRFRFQRLELAWANLLNGAPQVAVCNDPGKLAISVDHIDRAESAAGN